MLKFLTPAEQDRFKHLQSRLASFEISADEQKELNGLVLSAQKLASERDSVLQRIRADLERFQIQAHELFSASELRKLAAPDAVGVSGRIGRRGKGRAAVAEKRAGVVLIQVKLNKGAGAPSRYTKGQKLPAYVPKNFKQLDNGGDLATALSAYFTAEGKSHFATPEGQAELSAFVAFIRNGRQAPK